MAAERHVTALDGLRGLGVAMVVVHHLQVPGWGGLYTGVDLFFALSGLLITDSLLRTGAATSYRDFWTRRLWRIGPALLVLLGVFLAVSVNAPDRRLRLDFALAGLLQHINVDMTIGPPTSPHLGHLWSLSAEMQFYVLWPLLLVPLLRRRARPATLVGVALGLVALSAAIRFGLERSGTSWGRLYFGPDVRSTALFAGCAVALLLHWRRLDGPSRLPHLNQAAALLAIPTLAFMAWFARTGSLVARPHLGWGLSVFAVGAGILALHAADGRPSPVNRLLTLEPVVWLGRLSYGVYLWHVPFIAFTVARWPTASPSFKAMVIVPATLAAASASWYLLERPLLDRAARRRRARTSASATTDSAVGVST